MSPRSGREMATRGFGMEWRSAGDVGERFCPPRGFDQSGRQELGHQCPQFVAVRRPSLIAAMAACREAVFPRLLRRQTEHQNQHRHRPQWHIGVEERLQERPVPPPGFPPVEVARQLEGGDGKRDSCASGQMPCSSRMASTDVAAA